jgi:hypothetical protein
MRLSLNIVENNSTIERSILDILASVMDEAFIKMRPNLVNKIQQLVRDAIITEPEYQSLMSGQLKYELGIDSNLKIADIVDTWISNIDVNIQPIQITGSRLMGGIAISMIKEDYSDVLSKDSASIVDQNTGSVIPWLYWLLLAGGDILIRNYVVKMGSHPNSRSGNAIMVSSTENWRMPPQYAGTTNNNWVYRAISKLDSQIENILQTELEKAL